MESIFPFLRRAVVSTLNSNMRPRSPTFPYLVRSKLHASPISVTTFESFQQIAGRTF